MQEDNTQSMENTAESDPLNLMHDAPSEGADVAAAAAPAADASAPAADAAVADAPSGDTRAAGGHRKIRQGLVVSNKMNKSIVVKVIRRVRHPLYKKYFNKTKKYMAHDETNECKVGDTVRIVETRPLSARKRWRLDAIVERAK